jgi:hypothetical protein
MTQPSAAPVGAGSSNLYRNLLIGLVAVLVVGLSVGLIFALSGGDDSAGASVQAEPISTANDPFAPPVGTDQSIPPVQTNSPTTVAGGHVGLYGGTLNVTTCDKNQLVIYLQQNPTKAAAWASVIGITPAQIPSYVAGLTPVLLRSDTLVTNHGFVNGRATSIPAVLQAGTAVLVDDKGIPATKCYCGNPLTPPTYYSPNSTPTYYGPRWPGFSGTSITIIQNNTTIIDTFTLVDPNTGQSFTRPRGSDGTLDTPTNAPTTTLPTSPPTSPRTAPPTAPPTAPGPSAEDQAAQKVSQASQQCYPFPAPIENSTSSDVSYHPSSSPNSFVIQVVTQTSSGGTQTFTWSVDRSTLQFTPTNDLAQVASNHCSLLR